MGSRAITSIAVGLILMTCAVYFAPDSSRTLHNLLITLKVPDSILQYVPFLKEGKDDSDANKESSGEILFTPEELKKYDGSDGSKGLYLAILGEVFDVEKGAQHYRPGGAYAFFSGRDASRAYVTGDFTEAGLVDKIADLEASSLSSIADWLSFFKEEYKFIGKVIGRYYNKMGQPTAELLSVQNIIRGSKENKWLEDREKTIFPPCNSEWTQENGGKVWCSNKSGGVERSWVGVPRQLHKQGHDPSCVCVRDFGSPSSDAESTDHEDRGDLDHPDLKEYPGCLPTLTSCKIPKL